jgi:V8-like Glu-specific endopeptidase
LGSLTAFLVKSLFFLGYIVFQGYFCPHGLCNSLHSDPWLIYLTLLGEVLKLNTFRAYFFMISMLLGFAARAQITDGTFGMFEPLMSSSTGQEIIRATAALIHHDIFSGQSRLFTFSETYNMCSKDRNLEQQPLAAFCSATLISDDLILTAGHCFPNADETCKTTDVVFDFHSQQDFELSRIDNSKAYKCLKVIASTPRDSSGKGQDYALIQLDRKVTDRKPIRINRMNWRKSMSQRDLENIYIFGHPLGLPMKSIAGYIDNKDRLEKKLKLQNKTYFPVHALSPWGLSGSGVYNSKLQWIGILVRGGPAMESDDGSRPRCNYIVPCERNNCPWAHIETLSKFKIKELL